MPRIRTLKPQFWDSPSTAKADLAPRLLFMAMWNWADDAGRGTANLKELEAFAFPNDTISELPRRSRRNSAAVWPNFAELFWETIKAYEVTLYEVGGRRFFEISSFRIHQSKHFKPESSLPGPADGHPWDLASEYGFDAPPTPTPLAESRQESSRNSAVSCRESPLDRDKDRDRDKDGDVVYDDPAREHEPPPPDEPPPDDADAPPEHIDNGARPTKPRPTHAAVTVVRQELGNAGYPRDTINRLAIQVSKLAREQHPDTLIRQALHEWDKRPDALPEWLPTVYGDLVKNNRATPNHRNGSTVDDKVGGWLELANTNSTGRELE